MKAKPLTVHWHLDNQPIYSANFQPNGHRLATAGGDNNVRIWKLEYQDSENPTTVTSLTYLATLSKHTQAVNVVRFDPKGQILASAGDDGTIFLWTYNDPSTTTSGALGVSKNFGDELDDKEPWKLRNVCRSGISEIYDLAWSPDSQYILAGSMDNVARVYSATTGQCIRELAEHSHYVQGVAWDPFNEYIATQSSDRSVHIYNLKTRDGQFFLGNHHKIVKADLPTRKPPGSPDYTARISASPDVSEMPMNPPPPSSSKSSHSRKSSLGGSESPRPAFIPLPAVRQLGSPSHRSSFLYHNETFTSFFRRLTFTPDGSLLLTPSGVYKYQTNGDDEITNTVYIYTRAGLNRPPVAYLPGLRKPSLAIACSPVYYTLRGQKQKTQHLTIASPADELPSTPSSTITSNSTLSTSSTATPSRSVTESDDTSSSSAPVFALKYRIVYAVATQDSIIVYDTEQKQPLCVVSNLHYSTFTDLTWSPDGNNLLMTSTDGFCSVIIFENDELGTKYTEAVTKPTAPASSVPASPSKKMGPVPVVSKIPPVVSHGTPPQTPLQLAASSIKRPASTASNSSTSTTVSLSASASMSVSTNGEDSTNSSGAPPKKRRIAPTLISVEKKDV